jgi:hypothetical protein
VAISRADCPVSEDLNGWLGDHHTSEERLLPFLPSASTATGNSSALPTDAIFGLKPCWLAWFQNVVKSGGSTTPVTISQPSRLNAVIWAVKLSVRFW